MKHSRDGVVLLDEHGSMILVSPVIEEILGWDATELVGRNAFELVHPEDLERGLLRAADGFTSGGRVDPETLRLASAEGEWLPMEVAAAGVRDDDGNIDMVILNLRDVRWRVEADEALKRSERRFKALVQNSIDAVVVIDENATITYASPAIERLWGRPASDLVSTGAVDFIHPDDAAMVADAMVGVLEAPGNGARLEVRALHVDGTYRWVEAEAVNATDDEDVAGVIVNVRDVSERRNAQSANQRLLDIFEATGDLVGIADPDGEVLYFNTSARRFFDLPLEGDIAGFNVLGMLSSDETTRLVGEVQPSLDRDGMWSGEITVPRPDGELVPMLAQFLVHRDAAHRREFYSGILHDISARKEFESALAHQATHDPLTGLPNRSLLLDRLDVALSRARRHGLRVAVLFLDLDHFKVVNDSLGHELGDRLLVLIAERLQLALRPGDMIGRFGGDEFVVLCEDLHSRSDAIAIANRVISSVSGPFVVDEAEVFVGVSIGIAFPDDPDADPGTLIRDADAAMYRAKERGRGRWEIFDNDLRTSAVDRLEIENALRRALERRELRVFYQPMIDVGTGSISRVEALLRWEHHARGLLLPGEFITIAEETGLIVPIGLWVLDQACRQVQRWQASMPTMSNLIVSVNLSGRQLGHPKLVDDVAGVLSETGLPAERLELEITESVLMDDVEMSAETLGRLNELGVRLVIDDFGTGYSSMSYLRRFPVDLLKVDREFVDGLGTDPSDSAIVAAIITLAHTLGLAAVAEGVETQEQLDELRLLGCDMAQGFLIARPAPGDAIGSLLGDHPVW